MRPPSVTLAIAGAWLAAAGGVAAQDSIDAFQTLCLESGARSELALNAARAAGWRPLPEDFTTELATLADVQGPNALQTPAANGTLVLLTGSTPEEGDGLVGEHCNVFLFGNEPGSDAVTRISAWVGLEPRRRQGASDWLYFEVGGRRVPLERAPSGVRTSYGVLTLGDEKVTRHEMTRLEPAPGSASR